MVVRNIGNSLMVILPDLVGKKITYFFDLVRPLIAFKFQSVSSISVTSRKLKNLIKHDLSHLSKIIIFVKINLNLNNFSSL